DNAEAPIPLRLDRELRILAKAHRLARHDDHRHLGEHRRMHAGRALQQAGAGVQQHRLHAAGHLRVAHRHVDGQGLVPTVDIGRTRLLVDLLTGERLPHRRPFRTGRRNDVIEGQAAKRLEDRLAAVAILPHPPALLTRNVRHDSGRLPRRAILHPSWHPVARALRRHKEKSTMEFGMFHQFPALPGRSEREAFEEAFAQIDAAERWGLDVMWLAEIPFDPHRPMLSPPLTTASAVAARTNRIKIGIAVQVLPLCHPLRIAEEGATVDQISGGRLIFGVGRSGLPRTYEDYGVSYAESRDRFIEVLDIVEQAWSQPAVCFEGKYYN